MRVPKNRRMGARDEVASWRAGARPKTVTIVFADVVVSTALGERLDPESLQLVMSRYGAEMRWVVELHGGRVEKFIGDAVMAVFGVPVLHEDDALRAVRAGLGMRDAMTALNRELERDFGTALEIRIGVHTGEVITYELAVDQGLVAGDAVMPPRGFRPRRYRGRCSSVPARTGWWWGMCGCTATAISSCAERPAGCGHGGWGPAPGRPPLRAPRRAGWSGAAASCAPPAPVRSLHRGAAVPGHHGVRPGGYRQVAARAPVRGRRRGGALVVVGRCLPYGEGITYWPLREIVDDLGGVGAVAELMSGGEEDTLAAAMVSGAIGRSHTTASAQDVQWAVRRLLEAAARSAPVVVAFDDIHWAEPPLLDLIEYLAGYVSNAPMPIVCLARDDLLERRPRWATTFGRGATVRLRPLSGTDSARLLAGLVGRRGAYMRREEILAAAEGKPLYLEHLVAMRADDPAGATPPSIQALLAARVDSLPSAPRRVIEAAAIEGRAFHRGAISPLLADGADVDGALVDLEQRELCVPGRWIRRRAWLPLHARPRARGRLRVDPERRRADLHVAFAGWLGEETGERGELDEIIGYHLEQAYGYRRELGRVDAAPHRALAVDAQRI